MELLSEQLCSDLLLGHISACPEVYELYGERVNPQTSEQIDAGRQT